MNSFKAWFDRHFSDPQVVFLTTSLLLGVALIVLFGDIFAPVFGALVLAYLLEAPVRGLERWHLPRTAAVSLVVALLIAGLLFVLLALVPLLARQAGQLLQQVPHMVERAQHLLAALPHRHPHLFTQKQVSDLMAGLGGQLAGLRESVVARTLSVGMGLLTWLVYLVLIPVLVFLFLKDKDRILGWIQAYMPPGSGLAAVVWRDVDHQLGNYVRGKFLEIVLIWIISGGIFWMLGLHYAMLIGAVVGLSVLIPYVGAMVGTIPVAAVAYFQWGWALPAAYVLIAYGAIHFFDGNMLEPMLFAEVVDLHPVAIIVALLFFGGVWGFWGIFFAIPLAALAHAVLKAWPRGEDARRRLEDRSAAVPPDDAGD
ncbi:MAG TPA: AI-2E family transporter [Gammaproteobacteria bacterium]|nr:AI-2E family transporter [Gammaproteobacteria bacterium]